VKGGNESEVEMSQEMVDSSVFILVKRFLDSLSRPYPRPENYTE
jgi:hypothetical protein